MAPPSTTPRGPDRPGVGNRELGGRLRRLVLVRGRRGLDRYDLPRRNAANRNPANRNVDRRGRERDRDELEHSGAHLQRAPGRVGSLVGGGP